jgi:hypothetical protein
MGKPSRRKSDSAFGLPRSFDQVLDSLENVLNSTFLLCLTPFQLFETPGQILVRRE